MIKDWFPPLELSLLQLVLARFHPLELVFFHLVIQGFIQAFSHMVINRETIQLDEVHLPMLFIFLSRSLRHSSPSLASSLPRFPA